jgi:hypothetical protein
MVRQSPSGMAGAGAAFLDRAAAGLAADAGLAFASGPAAHAAAPIIAVEANSAASPILPAIRMKTTSLSPAAEAKPPSAASLHLDLEANSHFDNVNFDRRLACARVRG